MIIVASMWILFTLVNRQRVTIENRDQYKKNLNKIILNKKKTKADIDTYAIKAYNLGRIIVDYNLNNETSSKGASREIILNRIFIEESFDMSSYYSIFQNDVTIYITEQQQEIMVTNGIAIDNSYKSVDKYSDTVTYDQTIRIEELNETSQIIYTKEIGLGVIKQAKTKIYQVKTLSKDIDAMYFRIALYNEPTPTRHEEEVQNIAALYHDQAGSSKSKNIWTAIGKIIGKKMTTTLFTKSNLPAFIYESIRDESEINNLEFIMSNTTIVSVDEETMGEIMSSKKEKVLFSHNDSDEEEFENETYSESSNEE